MTDVDVTATPLILIDGSPISELDAFDLVDLRVSLTTGAAGFAELRFEAAADLAATVTVGSNIEVKAEEEDASTSVFKGKIMSVGIDVTIRQSHVVIGAYDESIRLGNRIDTTSHLQTSLGDLVSAMAGEAGLQADVAAEVSGFRFEHIQQAGTPHQFLTDLARAYGCEWLVANGKLIVRRRKAGGVTATFSGAESLRSFSARFSGSEQAPSVDVRGWDPSSKEFVNNKVQSSAVKNGHTVPITTKGVKGTYPGKDVVASPVSVSTATDAKDVATGIMHRLAASNLTGRGEVLVDGSLVPGSLVEIDDLDPRWNGKYYLTGVEHLFGRKRSFITKFTFGQLEPTSLVDLFSQRPPTTRERITSGIAVGVVTDTNDPDGLNRVKVNLPVLSDDNVSHWARIVSPGAGDKRGSMSIPEIDDEVAIAFENGDLQRPYVLGGLWNGKDATPEVGELIKNGKVMSRSMTSRNGHQYTMSDGDGDEDQYVQIALADGKTFLYLGHTMIEIETANKPVKITNQKATVELAENGDVTITGEAITIDAKKDLSISATNIKIDAKSKVTVSGKSGVEVKGSGPVKVESSAITEIKGSLVKIN